MAKDLNVLIRLKLLKDGVGSGLQSIGDSLDSVGTRVKVLAAAVAGYFGFQAFAGAIRGAADLEAKLSEVQAVSGASAQEMQALRKAAEDAGASTKYTSTEAAEALANLARAGLSAQDAIAALPPTLQLAQAGGIGLGQASEFITKAVAGMGLAFTDAGRVADVLAKGANASNTSVTGLAEALSYTAPIARSMGLDLEQTVAIIGKLADGGIDASRAGTALNAILSQFADPASKFRLELGQIGIVTNNFSEALAQLATKGNLGRQAILAVGTEAGPALRSLLNQGIGALTDLDAKLRDAKGSAAATAATMGDNLTGAVANLGSAWDTLKNALATPILPVLKQGATDLAKALQDAVSSGTVKRFGDSIATSFQAGITWAKAFAAQVDFKDVGARLDAFAAKAKAAFEGFAEGARNAANVSSLIYGVVSGVVSLTIAAFAKVSEAFAGVVSNILSGVSLLLEGWSKITFGSVSASFKQAADEIKVQAGAMWAASEALAQKAGESFDKFDEGAKMAAAAWTALTTDTNKATDANDAGAAAIDATTAALTGLAGAAEAAGNVVQASASQQAEALKQTQQAAAELKKGYEAAVAAGDWQGAAEKLQQLQNTIKGVASSAQDAAAEVENAFQRLGLKSSAELGRMADAAQRDFKIIRDSGTSTSQDVAAAFEKYAQAVVASGDQVKIAALAGEASFYKLEVAVDATGKAFVRSKDAATGYAGGLDGVRNSAAGTSTALERMNSELERQISAQEKANELAQRATDLQNKSNNVDANGFVKDKTGSTTVNAGGSTLLSLINELKAYGLDDKTAQEVARQFTDARGDVPYFNNPGQAKYGGSTLSDALSKAAQKALFGASESGGQLPAPSTAATSPTPATATPSSTSHTVTINLAGKSTTINTASAADASSLAAVLQQLEQEAARAA